jgi:hypothetical protein
MAWGSLVAHMRSIGGTGGVGVTSGDGSDSGAMHVRLGHPARVEARVGAREKLRVVGLQKVRGE